MTIRAILQLIESAAGFYQDVDDGARSWKRFRALVAATPVGRNEAKVFRGTATPEGQSRSANYLATYFTPSLSYVQNYSGEGGCVGFYVLAHTDRFCDLRHEEEGPGFGGHDSAFAARQKRTILRLAQRYLDEPQPTAAQVYALLENPPAEFIALLRGDGYYGLLTSEGDFSEPVYAVFNDHLDDCLRHVPFR